MRYKHITWPFIVASICGCSDVSRDASDAGTSNGKPDIASQTRSVVELTNRQPVFKSRSLDNINVAFQALLKRREGEIELIVPTTAGRIAIVGMVNVRKGSVTFQTAEGKLTYLPDDQIRITAGQESGHVAGWCAQGADVHIRIGPFAPAPTQLNTEAAFDVAVIGVNDVRDDEGDYIDYRTLWHAIPCQIRDGKAVVTLRLIASDAFEGEVTAWKQPAHK